MRAIQTVFLVALCVCVAAAAAAQDQSGISSLSGNQKLIDSYVLTIENVRKIGVVSKLYEAEGSKARIEDGDLDEQPLEKQWQQIEGLDKTGILRKAGISARDYLMTLVTVMQTTIDVELNGGKARTATNAANIAFFKKNRDEITKIIK